MLGKNADADAALACYPHAMTGIWHKEDAGWKLLAPSGFPDEKALHTLIEQAPHIMPLAGAPQLVVVGREVQLGNGYADLIAVESSGRLAVIEVKLANNAEARRAVVAQVLTYAAYLQGMDAGTLEQGTLAKHLHARGFDSLASAVSSIDQEGSFDSTAFPQGLADSLAAGRFRIVIVLDAAPTELVRLVGYLGSVTDKLVIDLITVSSYDINGTQVLIPQRVEPERQVIEVTPASQSVAGSQGYLAEGVDDFVASIASAPELHRANLRRLTEWAISLEKAGLVRLKTYHGKSGRLTLLPRLLAENVGLVTIWNDNGAYLSFWRSVFERLAPNSIAPIEALIAPAHIGQGNYSPVIPDELLQALTRAYEEAAAGRVEA